MKVNPYSYRVPRGEVRTFSAKDPNNQELKLTVRPLAAVQLIAARGRGVAYADALSTGRTSLAPVDQTPVRPDKRLCLAYMILVEAQQGEEIYSFEELATLALCDWATSTIFEAAAYAQSGEPGGEPLDPFAKGGAAPSSAPACEPVTSTLNSRSAGMPSSCR